MGFRIRRIRKLAEHRQETYRIHRFSAVCMLSVVAKYCLKESRRYHVRHKIHAECMLEEQLEVFSLESLRQFFVTAVSAKVASYHLQQRHQCN